MALSQGARGGCLEERRGYAVMSGADRVVDPSTEDTALTNCCCSVEGRAMDDEQSIQTCCSSIRLPPRVRKPQNKRDGRPGRTRPHRAPGSFISLLLSQRTVPVCLTEGHPQCRKSR